MARWWRIGLATVLFGCAVAGACAVTSGSRPASPNRTESLLRGYFRALDAAADHGPAAQSEFLRKTQHPQFTDRYCDNGRFTYTEDPAWTTLRADHRWAPQGAARPDGDVYALGVLFTARQDGALTDTQISTVRVVVLGGRVYGFSPCADIGQ